MTNTCATNLRPELGPFSLQRRNLYVQLLYLHHAVTPKGED